MRSFILILTTLFLFVACTKVKTDTKITTVKGEVRNKLTDELLANIPIEVRGCDYNGKCLTTVATANTNANGVYELSFEKKDGLGRHRINVGRNEIIPSYYESYLEMYKLNTINFSVNPYKIIKLNLEVNRHDKNWLNIGMTNGDIEGYWSSNFYFGTNPTINLVATYYTKIQAGRYYNAYVELSNRIANNTFQDNEFVNKIFYVDNIDTTVINFIVP
jgi:5-hydroxyisourate hydrolase-like protein (transthyretin family)